MDPAESRRELLRACLSLLVPLIWNAACTPSRPHTTDAERIAHWTVVEDLRIGAADGADAETFGQIRSILVDDVGRIFVLDFLAQEIRVFSPDGTPVVRLGRKGRGPGEFRAANGMAWGPHGMLYVNDPGNGRIMVLSDSGGELGTHRRFVRSYGFTWEGGVDLSGAIYDFTVLQIGPIDQTPGVKTSSAPIILVRYDPSTKYVDTASFPQEPVRYLRSSGGGAIDIPFDPTMAYMFDASLRHILFANTAAYRIQEITLGGDTVRTYEHAVEPQPVSEADRSQAMESVRRVEAQIGRLDVDASILPKHKPAIHYFVRTSTGDLWVRLETRDTSALFDVFNGDGERIAEACVPPGYRSYPRPLIVGDYFYAVTSDTLGVEFVVRGVVRRSH